MLFGNKIIVILVLLLTLGAVVGSLTLLKISAQTDAFLSTTSPKGTYTVRLTGEKDRPRIPLVEHQVRFSVSKDKKPLLANKHLHSGDWMDPSFELWFPEHTWIADDILHFYKKEFFADGQPESVVVLNKTSERIRYIKITSVDTFLLFDLRPESQTTLAVCPPRADSRWINVDGEFQDGRGIKGDGVGFLFPKDRKGPFTYRVYINENSLTIESPDLEQYRGNN